MGRKPKNDPMTEAALEVVRAETAAGELVKKEQELKEKSIAFISEMAGKVKAMNFTKSQAGFLTLVMLKQVKDSKDYRARFGMSWERFCEHVGVKRRTIDESLEDLEPFRADFLADAASFLGHDFSKIKQLGRAISGGAAEIKDNSIFYKGESVPLTPEHKDDIQGILDRIQDDLGKQLDEAKGNLKAKDRLLRDKDKHAEKLHGELARLSSEAEAKGLTPTEDAFCRQMDNLVILFDGSLFLKIDPERIDMGDKPTARMTSKLITTLDHMKNMIEAAYDTAVTLYGEIKWEPGMGTAEAKR